MKRLLTSFVLSAFTASLCAFAEPAAEIDTYVAKPAQEINNIKKQAKTDENLLLAEAIKSTREEADQEAIAALKTEIKTVTESLVIPNGKKLMEEPQYVAHVIRCKNATEGLFTTFIYLRLEDIIKTPEDIDAIMAKGSWEETATFILAESEKSEATGVAAEPTAETAVPTDSTETKAVPTQDDTATSANIEESEKEITEDNPKENVEEASKDTEEAKETEKATTPVAEATPQTETSTAPKTAFEKLIDDLSNAGMKATCKTKLQNAYKLHKIAGCGEYSTCSNPKASYIVASGNDGYVVLGPDRQGTRKNYTTNVDNDKLSNYEPVFWFRR
jgi:hypothetical protein